jgi:hypothetical protein
VAPFALDLPPGRIEPDAATFEDGRGGRPGPAQQGVHPGGEFYERERLGQVVVGADGQPGDPLPHRGGGGEHQHTAVRARVDQRPADVVAVHHRQVPVEHDHVVLVHAEAFERGVPVIDDVDGERLAPQPLGHGVREEPLVLHDQDAHAAILARPA